MEQFKIDDRHLTLFKRMNVDWWGVEFGAPAIDPKRPYGNGDVIKDMRDILHLSVEEDEDGLFPPEFDRAMADLHAEMKTALQVCLSTQSFETGLYEQAREYDSRSWVKATP